jgi:hypothetical protein
MPTQRDGAPTRACIDLEYLQKIVNEIKAIKKDLHRCLNQKPECPMSVKIAIAMNHIEVLLDKACKIE